MNLALVVGTLLVGQMIDANFDPNKPPTGQVVQPSEDEVPAARPDTRNWRPLGGRVDSSAIPRSSGGLRSRGDRQGTGREPQVPLAPTDPLLSAPDSSWTTPTESSPSSPTPNYGSRLGSSIASGSSAYRSRSSAYSRGSAAPRPTGRSFADLTIARQAELGRLEGLTRPHAPVAQQNKPFSGFTAPPAMSPYMGMYRSNQSQVDTYNTLVRPELQFQQQTQRFGGDIRGLQSAARLQGHALQRMGKLNQLQQGTMAPEYFNNYQMYYPMLSR